MTYPPSRIEQRLISAADQASTASNELNWEMPSLIRVMCVCCHATGRGQALRSGNSDQSAGEKIGGRIKSWHRFLDGAMVIAAATREMRVSSMVKAGR